MEHGSSLGPYVIDREIGSGGMGTVFRASVGDAVDAVAVKVVHPHLLDSEDAVSRFRREIEIGQTIRHPNVVRTIDGGDADGRHYLVMEIVEGQTLDALLDDLERVPEELCRHIGREVAKGLAAIHDAGVLHRDIKPANVLITAEHVVKIMDLGVARMMEETLRLSQAGGFVGSIHYAAPECFRPELGGPDERADLHALGLLLYELATGDAPYRAPDVNASIMRVLEEIPRRAGELNPQLSPFFEEVVHTLLVKDPRGRFSSAKDLLGVLESGESGTWWRARARALHVETKRPLRRVRIPRETAVYGRDVELAHLRRLFDQAKSGDGQVVLVEGEAGIGKSRLIDELIGRLHDDGEDVNFLFGSYPPGGAATAEGGFSAAYREQFGEVGSAAYLPENQILVPAFDALLRGEGAPPDAQSLNKGSLQTCFVRATERLAAERMTIVLIEDLHFAPEEGRALFTSLAMSVPGHRVLLVGTARPGVREDWLSGLTRLDQTSLLPLLRLGPKDLVNLLQDTLRSPQLARDLGNQIAVKSDGNPFFVFEILRGLREGQFITQDEDGTWVGTKVVDEIRIPSSVLDLVNARVAGLTEDERNLLDVAACWGFEFDPVHVGDALGLPRIPTLRLLGQIERQHRLVRSQGRRYAFDHHQVQEALYEGLNEYLRESYHAALAEALETNVNASEHDPETLDGALCVDLCDHFLRGAEGVRALRYLDRAHGHLRGGYLNEQAATLLGRVLSVPDLLTGTARVIALLRRADALDRMGRRVQQEEAAREAKQVADAAGDDALRIDAARTLGGVFWVLDRPDEAEAVTREALELARAIGDRVAEAGATGNLGALFYARGRLPQARANHERALALYRDAGARAEQAGTLVNLGNVAHDQGCVEEARERLELALSISIEFGDRFNEATATGNLGAILLADGRLPEAHARYTRYLAICREVGLRRGECIALGGLGAVSMARGRVSEAQEYFEAEIALSPQIGHRSGEAIAQYSLATVFLERGEPARAEEGLVSALAIAESIGFAALAATTQLTLGSFRAREGDTAGARESLVAARDRAAKTGDAGTETLARCELACLPGGDADDAVTAFSESEERLRAAQSREARFLLWKATGDRAHLVECKRLLDDVLALVDDETRGAMLANLRLNREITAEWNEHGGDAAGE